LSCPALEHTTLDVGVLGKTNAFLAFAGSARGSASRWVLCGVLLFAVAAQPAVQLRPLRRCGGLIAGCFTVVAAVCFIGRRRSAGCSRRRSS